MKKVLLGVVVFVVMCAVTGFALASMKTIEFPDGATGKVIFDGKMHNQKLGSAKCGECHGKGIPFKAPGAEGSLKITMDDINAGKVCGLCHNGTKAFSAKDPANCGKCHKK